MLEPEREQSLLDLAREAPLGRQEQIFGELLTDRAAALNDTAGGNIGEGRPDEPERVDPEMAVEPAVLGRDDGLWQIGRHFLQGQWLPEEVAKGRQQAAVGGQYRDTRTAFGAGELAGVGQSESEVAENEAADDRDPQKQQNAELGSASPEFLAAASPSPARARTRWWPHPVGWVEPQLRLSHRRPSPSSRVSTPRPPPSELERHILNYRANYGSGSTTSA